ncbi:MAG: hypothetical protein LBU32_33355 [Clostridiales bacterium]|nr:hypothetical protein [Clostridiales bacterium]
MEIQHKSSIFQAGESPSHSGASLRLSIYGLTEQMYDIVASEISGVLFDLPGWFHDVHRVFGSSAQLYMDRQQANLNQMIT